MDELYGELRREHLGYAMIEQLDLARNETVKVYVCEVVRTVVLDLNLKLVQLVCQGQQCLEM